MADVASTPASAESSAPAAAPASGKTRTPKKAAAPKAPKAPKSPKAPRTPKPKGERKGPTHPPTASLVTEAIGKLAEKGGSSLQAIKKSIAGSHVGVDVERLTTFIRKFLKSAVEKGILLQPKGKGATGSFKLAVKPKKVAVKKPAGVKKPKVKKVSLLLYEMQKFF